MTALSAAACPGCLATPVEMPAPPVEDARIALSLPGIHCQACISTVERTLNAVPGVRAARVNLTLKRALIDAAPDVSATDLAALLQGAGYEAHELDADTLAATKTDAAGRALLIRLAVAGFAAMNVMLLSVSVWSGASDATRDMFHWISAAIALPCIAYAGQPFFLGAYRALRARRLSMDVPISLGIVLALATSLWETTLSGHHAWFDAALTLTFFLLAGRYLDHRARAIARSAAEELTALEVPRATRLDHGVETEVPVAALKVGDLVLVRPGGRMPVDGEVIDGRSEIDRSLLTGETLPVFAAPGLLVSAGEVNLTGPLTLRANAVGAETSLHRMAELVAIAESGRANYTPLADAMARMYAPAVHVLSGASLLGWFLATGDLRLSLNIAAAVLIITCPCALGLAVPAVTTAASGRLFRKGLLVKDATALERLAEADCVVFDKTGTLTAGTPDVTNLHDHADALPLALALAQGSRHPLSVALTRAIRAEGIAPAAVTELREIPGYGTEGRLNGQTVRLGRAAWMGAPEDGDTAAWLSTGTGAPLPFRFTDALRDGAQEAVAALKASGKRVILLSGDSEGPVRTLAGRLGIDDWHAAALPADKATLVRRLGEEGVRVLMVGDGLNDTAALAAAHVSISPASALDAARTASDMVLLGTSLAPIADACAIARAATARIRENFTIAILYNCVAVPLAIAGLATPLIAALAMSASSITVSLNALRLGGRE
ncbi:MAG: cadmium-translocating P-type ATPase [Pseudooceanicola sp.]|nr:cadmium-translocating P-type ATPase [Pseudooceanicola sp.]